MKKLLLPLAAFLLVSAGCGLQKTTNPPQSNRNELPVQATSTPPVVSSTTETQPIKVIIPQGKFELKVHDSKSDTWVKTKLTEKNIVDAQAQIFNAPNGINTTVIKITLNTQGVSEFYKITSENIFEQVEIFLDGVLLSTPTVQQAISNGAFTLSVDASLDQAETWANKMRGFYYENPTDK